MNRLIAVLALISVIFIWPSLGFAQTKEDTINDLLRQVNALVAELKSLQERVLNIQPQPSAPAPQLIVLRRGNRGKAVGSIQKRLIDFGLLKINQPTDYFGPLTEAALKEFQEINELEPTGRADSEIINLLNKELAPGALNIQRLIQEGAGESGKVPPGLLRASGLLRITGTSSATTTPSPTPTATSTPTVSPTPTVTTTPSLSPTPTATTTPTTAPTPSSSPTPGGGSGGGTGGGSGGASPTPTSTPTPIPSPGADITPPTIVIVNPADNATIYINGTITVLANVSDNVGVIGVQFKLDGGNLGSEIYTSTSTLSSAVTYWNPTGSAAGSHTISAVARDAAGNTATASIQVTVVNNSSTPSRSPTPSGNEMQITTSSAIQAEPRIYGNFIVWNEYRSGYDRNVYLYDLSNNTERQITSSPQEEFFPSVYGNRIVYVGRPTSTSLLHIYLYDLSTNFATLLSNNSYMQTTPFIYGTNVAYADNRAGGWDVYLYNLNTGTEQALTTNHSSDSPAVSDNYIVWMNGAGGIYKTHYYNLNTGVAQAITSSNSDQMYPYVDGSKIVYSGRATPGAGGSAWDIYLYDINTGTESKLTSQSGVQNTHPAISGNYAAWVDYRNGYSGDIYLYNLTTSTETRITSNSNPKYNRADIDGNKIIWSESRNNNYDIYLYTISSGSGQAPSKVNALAQILQAISRLLEDILKLVR